jgi:hypothetical protein
MDPPDTATEIAKATLTFIFTYGQQVLHQPRDFLLGHCLEAGRLSVPIRPLRSLAQDQEPDGTSGEARGG